MLRWLSSKSRRSSGGSSAKGGTRSLHRISLELPNEPALATSRSCTASTSSSAASAGESEASHRSASASAVGAGAAAAAKGSLRRRSLPALHLQEDNSAAIMSNPPVFNNPLRRRGCCDHSLTQQMSLYRAEAIQREQAIRAASVCIPVEGTA